VLTYERLSLEGLLWELGEVPGKILLETKWVFLFAEIIFIFWKFDIMVNNKNNMKRFENSSENHYFISHIILLQFQSF
jgi:hypothetical protein